MSGFLTDLIARNLAGQLPSLPLLQPRPAQPFEPRASGAPPAIEGVELETESGGGLPEFRKASSLAPPDAATALDSAPQPSSPPPRAASAWTSSKQRFSPGLPAPDAATPPRELTLAPELTYVRRISVGRSYASAEAPPTPDVLQAIKELAPPTDQDVAAAPPAPLRRPATRSGTAREQAEQVATVHARVAGVPSRRSEEGTVQDAWPQPSITVTIGRVEVRAVHPTPPSARESRPPAPRMTLEDYQRKLAGGAR